MYCFSFFIAPKCFLDRMCTSHSSRRLNGFLQTMQYQLGPSFTESLSSQAAAPAATRGARATPPFFLLFLFFLPRMPRSSSSSSRTAISSSDISPDSRCARRIASSRSCSSRQSLRFSACFAAASSLARWTASFFLSFASRSSSTMRSYRSSRRLVDWRSWWTAVLYFFLYPLRMTLLSFSINRRICRVSAAVTSYLSRQV